MSRRRREAGGRALSLLSPDRLEEEKRREGGERVQVYIEESIREVRKEGIPGKSYTQFSSLLLLHHHHPRGHLLDLGGVKRQRANRIEKQGRAGESVNTRWCTVQLRNKLL